MSALPFLRRRRERRLDERRLKNERLWRALVGMGLLLAGLFGALIIGSALAYAALTADLPSVEVLPALLEPPNGSLLQPTRIYDRTGAHLLAVLAPQDAPRVYASISPLGADPLPDILIKSTVALLDQGFYSHPGYSLEGLTRPDEHPTLAQKLVADLLLWNEPPTLRRALRERILAAQLTSRFGRDKVLEWYFNSAWYGRYAYGVDAASQLYFGKPVSQIDLAEVALLVATSESPAINPLDAPQAVLQRQQDVLSIIQSYGLVSEEQVNLARYTPVMIQPARAEVTDAPAFVALALAQLDPRFDRARVERGGMVVLTTLDYDLQQRATCAVQAQLARLGDVAAPNCDSAASLPPLPPGSNAPNISGSAVVLDPRTGQVLALVGDSKAGTESPFLTPHRPGTLLTPFVYLTGFTRGLSPASLMWDIPQPGLSAEGDFHGPVRLRVALSNDYLVSTGQVFDQMGASLIQQTMRPFGLDISAPTLVALTETENLYTVVEMARAYGVLAAQGSLIGFPGEDGLTPSALLSIRGADGRDYADWSSLLGSEQIATPQLAYLVTDVLSDGTVRNGQEAFELGRPAAAKVGLTANGADTWAVGYTPHRAVAVWLGGSEGLSTRPVTGLWSALMQAASREVAPDGWNQPPGMIRLNVCDPSGMLPTSACPNVVTEVFIDGYQPVQPDTLYRTYAVNRESGLLATVFTPPQLVEERVYMLVPPQAADWAVLNQIETPPTTYDTLQPPAPDPNVNLLAPEMLANLKGKVDVTGTAAGEDFAYYRLQYGQGLNPQTWVLISEGRASVSADSLAEWDTSGLSGLYALQLVVIGGDNSLETATVQVTVDNDPPQIGLDFPREGAEISLAENPKITFQPRVLDNLFLERVEIYIDGKLLKAFASEPFAVSWTPTRGEHTIRVVARDRMGNENEVQAKFTLK